MCVGIETIITTLQIIKNNSLIPNKGVPNLRTH